MECSASIEERFFGCKRSEMMTLAEYEKINREADKCPDCNGSGRVYSDPKGKGFSDEWQNCACVPREPSPFRSLKEKEEITEKKNGMQINGDIIKNGKRIDHRRGGQSLASPVGSPPCHDCGEESDGVRLMNTQVANDFQYLCSDCREEHDPEGVMQEPCFNCGGSGREWEGWDCETCQGTGTFF